MSTKILFLILTLVLSLNSLASDKEDKIAVINFKVMGGQTLNNHIQHIDNLLAKSKKLGAEYVLLPELIQLDLFPVNPPDKTILSELTKLSETSATYEDSLKNLSKKYNLNLIGASVVIKQGEHFINRAFYIRQNGEVNYQDKIQPTPWELKYHFVGGEKIKLLKTENFSFVILICHDAEFPQISSALVTEKPEVIFVPSQTDDLAGLNRVKFTSQARAVEHMAYVLMTGTSGDEKAPWHTYQGKNFQFGPQNKYFPLAPMEDNPAEETVSLFKLNLQKLRKSRADKTQVYPAR